MTEVKATNGSAAAPSSTASGWVEAGGYVLCVGVLGLTYGVGVASGAHPIVFVLYSLIISAVALLSVTGVGSNARAIIFNPATWLVGFSNIAVEAGYASLVVHVPPADGSLMIRMSIPVTLIIGVVMFGRRPGIIVWLGAAVVTAVVGYLLSEVQSPSRAPVFASAATCAIAVAVRAFASEFHKWNRLATTIVGKMQVTGLVTLVTAFTSLIAIFGLMTAVRTGMLPALAQLPTPDALLHIPTILMSVFVGGALFTAMTYLSFSSVVKIRSENFIAISAFMPLATLAVQTVAASIGLIVLPPFDWRLLPAIMGAIAGVLMMIWGNRKV